jgi:23S rRNA pseudouridine2605 synthase
VYDCLPAWVLTDNYIPVGRLDLDSRGLLLFTQDARLMNRLTCPGQCLKTYEVWVRGRVTDAHIGKMLEGVETARKDKLRAVEIERMGGIGRKTRLRVVLDEGKNRHIRRMFGSLFDESTGRLMKVMDLKRTGFGPVQLDILSGNWRFLSDEEEKTLYKV